jgi:hypothetical protein
LLFDLRTPSATDNVRNIVVCTSLEDRLLVVSFNVIESLEPQWLTAGNQIIRSIEIK